MHKKYACHSANSVAPRREKCTGNTKGVGSIVAGNLIVDDMCMIFGRDKENILFKDHRG